MHIAIVLMVSTVAPAVAHDWQPLPPGYWCEVRQARWEAQLDSSSIWNLVNSQNWQANEAALNQFGRTRPVGSPQPAPAAPQPER